MGRRIAEMDWSGHSLGATTSWPAHFKAALAICLSSRFPMFIWWGPELINFYNDAYIPILGKRHPASLGQPASTIWSEVWPAVGAEIDLIVKTSQASWQEQIPLVVHRNGYPETAYFTWSTSPIVDEKGQIGGVLCIVMEETRRVLTELERRWLADQRQLALDAAHMGWWHLDPVTNVASWDQRYKEIFGVTGDSRPNDQILKILHPDDLPAVLASVDAALNPQDPKPYSAEYRIRRPDGTLRWIEAHGVASFEGQGIHRKAISFVGTVADITNRRRSQERDQFLITLDEAVRPLAEPDEIILTAARLLGLHLDVDRCAYADIEADQDTMNLAGNYLRNSSIKNIVGRLRFTDFGAEVLQSMRDNKPYVVNDVDTHQPPVGDPAAYRATQIQAVICVPLHKSGRFVAAMAVHSKTPRFWHEDEVDLVLSVANRCWEAIERGRVTRTLRESEERFRNLFIESERIGRLKDEFLATLSHELRTPLNAILGWSQILQTKNRSEQDLKQGLEVIQRNTRAQTQLVEDLLDMSRIISGKVRLDVQDVSVPDVIRAAVDTVKPTANARGVEIISVSDASPATISGDAGRLHQVMWNLLNNAVKFTPREGQVRVGLQSVGTQLEITVADTGKGITEDFLPFVFDRFRQADASTTRKFGGLGLGLSITRHLVELHGGTISVRSAGENQGAEFTIMLPSAPIREPDPTGVLGRRASSVVRQSEYTKPNLAGVSILLVDDEKDSCDVIKRILDDCGAHSTSTNSAREALTLLPRLLPTVLISDIGMPEMDGYELLRSARALPQQSGGTTPAIALTAFARAEDRQRALLAGYQMHIAKPVEAAELVAAVASLAGRTRPPPS